MIVIVAFFVLLLLGIPISMVVLGASTLGVILYSGTPLQIVVQQMFSGLNNYVLLAIPFFIVSGTIASRGSTSKYLCQVMTIIFGRMRGGSVLLPVHFLPLSPAPLLPPLWPLAALCSPP